MESNIKKPKYEYPYIPEGKEILCVSENNEYMIFAKKYAKKYRSNLGHPAAAVVVKDKKILSLGSIGNNPIHIKGCVRVDLNIPTGERYELCEGCNPKFHSEVSAIKNAKIEKKNIINADLYLWGHWWCCKNCWKAMIKEGIRNVYLLENSEILFNKKDPNNIIGKQFDKTP